jgi:hypothetical protein
MTSFLRQTGNLRRKRPAYGRKTPKTHGFSAFLGHCPVEICVAGRLIVTTGYLITHWPFHFERD